MRDDELDELLGRGDGDPDMHGYPEQKPDNIHYIGQDKALVERSVDKPLHWTEQQRMGLKKTVREPRELGDELADHSDNQGYDNWEEENAKL